MSELASLLETLSPERRRLLLLRLRGGGGAEAPASGAPEADPGRQIARRPPGTAAPLSFSQQRLWFLEQLDPESAAYNLAAGVELRGRLSVPVLAAAADEIVRRHESLRTTFAAGAGRSRAPVQTIAPRLRLGLPVLDLQGLPPGAGTAEVFRQARLVARRPYDLARGPLLRLVLIRLEPERHALIMAMHHIVSDAWSFGIFVRELVQLYEAFARRSPLALPELPVQYADFALWQREQLREEAVERDLAYWRTRLAEAPQVLELPTDRPRPAAQSFRGRRVPVALPESLAGRLKELGRQQGATLFMVLLAAYQGLLCRYTGQKDVVVGTPTAGRDRLEVEGLIGFFVNTLVLRTDLGGDPSFLELLGRVREGMHSAYAHQNLPFEKLVEELQPERNPSHSPLFQVVLNLLNAPAGALDLPGLRLSPLEIDSASAMFDLILTLEETVSGLTGTVEYDTALFERPTILRLARHLETLLRSLAAAPESRLSELPLLAAEERAQVVREWNDTALAHPRTPLIHELFAARAALQPNAPAVLCGGRSLTYRQLADVSHRLAWQLRSLGIGRGDLVGVLLDRSLEMVPSLLGILGSGAAYVPLETRQPEARLRWIVQAMGIRVLIVGSSRLDQAAALLPDLPALRHLVCPDLAEAPAWTLPRDCRLWVPADLERCPANPPETGGDPDDLAYVIFTSGSTGTPKGVMERHRPVFNLIDWINRTFAMGPADRVLFVTSLGFDLSVYDIFGMLAAGGSIRVVVEEELESPEALARALAEEPITLWDSAPAALQQLVPHLAPTGEKRSALRLVFLSGDWIPLPLPDQVRAAHPGARVIALGGATEATVWSNFFQVGAVDPAWRSIPYGRPIQNARYHVLEESLHSCPIGVPGDLYIGGGCLSSGYAGEPRLTADKYLPDPFGGDPGGVIYRTGDRARLFADGTIEFLGRLDHQVKIRGFRIELGEIEAALGGHPAVREAVVLALAQEPGSRERRLAAYVVPAAEPWPAARDLRAWLKERLPEYMVPPAFVFLDSLPVTTNGKLDRKALPAPERAASAAEGEAAPPRNPIEEVLTGIWSEILDVAQVGIHDSFFDLGGHSLLATRLVARVRESFGVDLSLRSLFDRPTVEQVAAMVAVGVAEGAPAAPPIRPVPRDRDLPLSFAQERLWVLHRLEPESPAYNVPAAIHLRGVLDEARLERCLGEVVRRHEVLRTTFRIGPEGPVQAIAPPAERVLPRIDLTALMSEIAWSEARSLAAEEALRPFDLAAGPLLRTVLVRCGGSGSVLLLGMHHTVSDAWSIGILVREMATLYRAMSEGIAPDLPELPAQYADFAVWQRSWLAGAELERQLGYWRGRLAGSGETLELATDRPRPPVQTFRGAFRSRRLAAAATAPLEALGRREGVTRFMILLAAFAALLSRHSGQESVVVGSPIANRGRPEVEGAIGLFVNTLALRVDLAGDPGFGELLARVRRVAIEAYAHQDLPFERLVEELRPERDLSRPALFQVMLVFQDAPLPPPELPGLTLSPLPQETRTAKFDLTLEVVPGGGLTAGIEYNSDLFDTTTVLRLLDHLERLLAGAAAHPERRISELPLLSEAERRQVTAEWSDTAAGLPADATFPGLFAAQAARTPEEVALTCGEARLSYRELAARAERLARHLRAQGVGPDVVVGICVERSIEMVVGVLGILAAGGAYLPLHPSHPPRRRDLLLAEAGVRVLLTGESLRDPLPDGAAAAHRVPGLPESLAYVIYTSGSTGRPKGVMVSHRGLLNYLLWSVEAYGASSGTGSLVHSALGFDLTVTSLLVPLLAGRTVRLVPEGDGVEELAAALLASRDLTLLKLTPAHLEALRSRLPAAEVAGRARALVIGGEALPGESLGFWLDHAPGTRLVNEYGPTETVVGCCVHEVPPGRPPRGPVPIGRPVANTRMAVLDPRLELMPLGAVGELFIGGAGVARGYLGRPELTAERFLPDPFAEEPGARLYRTGDLGRWRPDGVLEFLGRNDSQVKVRGFRIELGEVEAALRAHPQVRDAAVLARPAAAGDLRLIGCVAADPERLPAAELRRFLKEILPGPMVPSRLVFLEALPLTANGKVDRRALERIEPEGAAAAPEGGLPRTPAEELVAGIWAQVLGRGEIGTGESFFDLGGHSLLATQAVARLEAAFGIAIPLRRLFEHPTVEAFAAALEADLSARGGAPLPPPVVPALRGDLAPLSFAQERLWVLAQMDAASPAYNIPVALRLRGALDPAALELCLAEAVRRHEALRTTLRMVDGSPRQVIAPAVGWILPQADLMALPEPLREAEALRLAGEDARRPFDLALGPLLRTSLLRLGELDHVLLLDMHHAISDGWSMGVLVREVTTLYAAFHRGEPSPLPELPLQYADFALWQRAWLAGEELERQLGFWRERLAGAPEILELPADRPRPPVQSQRGARRFFALDAGSTAGLKRLGRTEGATLFMTLLAGFAALLARSTRSEDIVVGSPIANRNRAETEGLIGFFVNTLVLRIDLTGDPSWRELLDRARRVALAAYAHQDLPFERLVEAIQPQRALSHHPLFQVMLVLQNTPLASASAEGLTVEALDFETGSAKFDATLALRDAGDRLEGSLEYSVDLFDGVTVDRLLDHLARLLTALAQEPDRPAAAAPLLGDGERQQLLIEWADTASGVPQAPIHELFEEQAARTPEAPVVTAAAVALGYGELNARANRLARHLRRLGVGPEVAVGLYLERSPELVLATLAVLKAGGVYVPLDPAHPRERISLLLADVGAAVLVTEDRLAASLPPSEARVVRLDTDATALDREPSGDLGIAVSPEGLAYIMYTSGSSGRPKGVAVTHAGVVRLVRETGYARFGPDQTFLQLAPASFDAATLEIWGALLNGGRLAVFPPGALSLDELGEVVEREGVTTLWLTAGLFHQMVESQLHRLAGVRQLLAGGDVVSPAHARRVLEELPACRLINGYGPTENTTFTCCHPVRPEDLAAGGSVPIGRAIANTRVHLLDAALRPVPIGVPGELCTAGSGLARGYFRNPALTAEKFVPDPFGLAPGTRMYRTGDLARRLPDGRIEFLGRLDQQVKLRGFRIEPGEIEAVLAEHPAVAATVVVVRDDLPGGRGLAGYVVPAEGTSCSVAELRAALEDRLPDYMVPSALTLLPALPLTPNGKVDRRALPAPGPDLRRRGFLAPRTITEELLAGIYGELLRLENIGAEDDFFELGGHSLLATQLASRVREVLGVELPVREVFDAPKVAALAASIEQIRRGGDGVRLPAIERAPRDRPLPLSFAQQRLWFLEHLGPGSSYNVPAAVRWSGRLDIPVLQAALSEIVRRHEALRTVFAAMDGEPVQVIVPERPVSLPVIDLAGLPAPERGAEVARRIREEAVRPFDLARGPLLRAALLDEGDGELVVLLTMHHIASDGWSRGVLVRELGALYESFSRGLPSPLPELEIQYGDFAAWQRLWLTGEVLAAELAFWRRRLEDLPPVLELPADHPRPPVFTTSGARLRFVFGEGLTAGLSALSRRHGATLFMTLLAAFQALLSRLSGQCDIAVGTPVAGRDQLQTEGLIGFFVNTLVLRSDLSGERAFADLIERVREMTLAAYAHAALPFEKLVEELRPERDLGHTPLFQVMLALQNAPLGELRLADVHLRPLPDDEESAKFDLSLFLREREGGLAGALSYRRDLFDATTLRRWLGHFEALLTALAEDVFHPLSELPLLQPAEVHQLRVEWNDTSFAGRPLQSMHERFAEHARRTPGAVAVTSGERVLTCGELDHQAHQLAGRLRSLGAGPEAVVGLCMERSAEMVVALLGVLKAGAAYLPLDPAYPEERLLFLLADAGAPLLLVHPPTAGRLAAGIPRLVLDLKEGAAAPAPGPPLPPADPRSLAYVIYTSGSTGRPKGVMVPHGGLSNYLDWCELAYGTAAGSGSLVHSSLGFDLTVTALLAPLASGRQVHLLPEGAGPDELAARLRAATDLSLVKLTPAHLEVLRHLLPAAEAAGRTRALVIGGEALAGESLAFFRAHAPETRLINEYGPTETVVGCAVHEAGPGEPLQGPVPIGRPIFNTRMHVLGRNLIPVPIGAAGELCIGGAGVARGYLGRPDLTAEKLVPDPFGDGARLYRTGDLGRLRPDGVLEFLGREDFQVKVRGFRVELGEIEAALLAHPAVREAAVLALEDAAGGRSLVAYLAADGAPPAGELRRLLGERLPEHMLPSAVVALDRLPLTPNGKVDRRALARLAPRPEAKSEAAPRTPVEELVAGIWCEVLRRGAVGPADDFFELGGHSLLAVQMVSRLERVFGITVPLRQIFQTPTVAGLAGWIETGRAAGRVEQAPPIVPVPRDGILPLSFAQERLWFLHRLDPGSAAYNMPVRLRCTGALSAAILERCLGELVRRHESLRTTFPAVGGLPVQAIAPVSSWSLPVADLAALPETAQEDEVRRLAHDETLRPFDLARGPLLRAALLRPAEENQVLLLTLHHIVSDGWSQGVLVRELGALYEAFSRGLPSPLPELEIQYADFAVWQRRRLSREVLASELAFWRGQLADLPPVLELPTDRPRPPVFTTSGARLRFVFGEGLTASLSALSRRHGATLFMTLLAAFQALLARLSGHRDIAVGTPVAGRDQLQTEGLIGFFVNTLVLRSDLSGEPAFTDLIERVRETALAAYAHADLPFEKLVEELRPERDLGHTPLFQVMLALQNTPLGELRLAEARLSPLPDDEEVAKLDLSLFLRESEGGLTGSLSYRRDLFEAATLHRWLGYFETLLTALAGEVPGPLEELPLLGEAERLQLLLEWNDTEVPRGSGLCLHEEFARQAARTPEEEALHYAGRETIYRDLDRSTNRLARFLRACGVGPEVLVGVCLPRSPELIESLLAILKAGGAYVPLDPGYPRERLDLQLKDSRLQLLLTHSSLLDRLPDLHGRVLCLDQEEAGITSYGAEPLAGASGPENAAYVIYTSGSTGVPKGVEIEHRSAAALLGWARENFAPEELSRVVAATSVCFDLSVFEIFVPLSMGGCVVLAQDALDLPALAGATLLNTVPSAVAELCRLGALPPSLRTINLAGEALRRSLAEEVFRASGIERLWNLYGPTEDTTYSTASRVDRHDPREPAIGRPLPGTRADVVTAGWHLAPMGVPGELCLGGTGLARGYLNQPSLTAARFVPDPFGGRPGARLYRTGDLVRRRSDGELEFLGRIDRQVKVRGFRIEPGEIEAVLASHPAVREAVVLAQEDGPGGLRLVACLVLDGELPAGELRRLMNDRLPGHMRPTALVPLERLPLTPNGKVDRRALARLAPRAGEKAEAAPRTPVEEIVAGIWSEVLRVEDAVGPEDDFFELGGHSLLAAQVASRLERACGITVPLRQLFQTPTVAGLAAWIETGRASGRGEQAPPIVPVSRSGALPLSFAQERLWFLHRLDPGSAAYNMPVRLRCTGALSAATLERCLGELVRRHESLRTTFPAVDGLPVQAISPASPCSLPVADLAALPETAQEDEVRRLARDEALRPFDLARGPLLRAALLRLAEDDQVLLLTLHHIVSDGWSQGVLVRELGALYEAFSRGLPSPLPELEIQYADFAVWQRRRLTPEVLASELAFWRRELADLPPVLDLPTDHPRPAVFTTRGDRLRVALGAELSARLQALSRRQGATLFMTLLAAFQALLSRLSGQSDVAVGTPVAGRNQLQTEGLIGFFVNTLVLRSDLSDRPALTDLIERVRETALAAYAHADLPFEKLVEELRPERDLGQTPLFQAMLALQNMPLGELRLAEVRLSPLPEDEEVAKLDLSLFLRESDGGLTGALSYRRDLFEAATLHRWLGHFETLLTALAGELPGPLEELPLLGEAERLQLDRRGKVERRAPRPQARTGGQAPRTPVEKLVAGLWCEALRRDAVSAEDDFFELGGHSLLAVQVASRLERACGLAVPLRQLFQTPTVSGLAAWVEAEKGSQALPIDVSPLVELQPEGPGTPFFFVHPVGGSVFCYHDLARHLAPEHPFYAFQAAGLEEGQSPRESIEEMAGEYLAALRRHRPEGICRLGGWSFGGLVALAMARRLRAEGREVEQLVLLDTHLLAPEGGEPPLDEIAALRLLAHDLGGLAATRIELAAEDLAGLDGAGRLRRVLGRAREAGALPAGVEIAKVERLVRLYQAHLGAARLYRPAPYEGRIELVLPAESARPEARIQAWTELAAGGLAVHPVPGDHYTMLREPHVAAVAARIRTPLGL